MYKAAEEEGSGYPYLPPKAAESFAVSNNFNQQSSGRRYLYRAVIPVQLQWPMDGGMGKQHPLEQTRDLEWRQRGLAESEAEAEAKREVGVNCDKVKRREDK